MTISLLLLSQKTKASTGEGSVLTKYNLLSKKPRKIERMTTLLRPLNYKTRPNTKRNTVHIKYNHPKLRARKLGKTTINLLLSSWKAKASTRDASVLRKQNLKRQPNYKLQPEEPKNLDTSTSTLRHLHQKNSNRQRADIVCRPRQATSITTSPTPPRSMHRLVRIENLLLANHTNQVLTSSKTRLDIVKQQLPLFSFTSLMEHQIATLFKLSALRLLYLSIKHKATAIATYPDDPRPSFSDTLLLFYYFPETKS